MYPRSFAPINHVAPAPRRVRGFIGGRSVFDTLRALYVWEWPHYPQYYISREDIDMSRLTPAGAIESTPQGMVQPYELRTRGAERLRIARGIVDSPIEQLADTIRFDWDALDEWYEEDEEVFVHPRNPYSRVDAIRSNRGVRVERDGVTLAEATSCIMVFETGLPTRYYLDRGNVNFDALVPSETRTACPYKGRTTGYWSVRIGDAIVSDLAWSYTFPTLPLLPIAGLVAFLNEKVDIVLDGMRQERPVTPMS